MVRALAAPPLNESIRLPPSPARSPRVSPRSMHLMHAVAALAGIHLSPQVFCESTYGHDRRVRRSHEASSLASNAPTSGPSDCPNSRSVAAVSSATLLPPLRWLVCCIDRLNPPPRADRSPLGAPSVGWVSFPFQDHAPRSQTACATAAHVRGHPAELSQRGIRCIQALVVREDRGSDPDV